MSRRPAMVPKSATPFARPTSDDQAPCGEVGRAFQPVIGPCELASTGSRRTVNDYIASSSRAGVAQLVERVLAKHKVDGSKPFTRSSRILPDYNFASYTTSTGARCPEAEAILLSQVSNGAPSASASAT